MSKILWICMQCFKRNDPPEEVKSNKKSEDISKSTCRQSVQVPFEDNLNGKKLDLSDENLENASFLQIRDPNKYVRSKYVREKYKTSQNDVPLSESSFRSA